MNILDKIVAAKKIEVAERKGTTPLSIFFIFKIFFAKLVIFYLNFLFELGC